MVVGPGVLMARSGSFYFSLRIADNFILESTDFFLLRVKKLTMVAGLLNSWFFFCTLKSVFFSQIRMLHF